MLFESANWTCQALEAKIILIILNVSEKGHSSTLEKSSVVKH